MSGLTSHPGPSLREARGGTGRGGGDCTVPVLAVWVSLVEETERQSFYVDWEEVHGVGTVDWKVGDIRYKGL